MNDEKRHKTREIRIYKSLIITIGIMAVILFILSGIDSGSVPRESAEGVYAFSMMVIGPIAFLAIVVTLFLSVFGFFTCSWLLRKHLLLWYGCMFTLILIMELTVSPNLADNILNLGVVILFVLPVIWVRNASRS